MALTILSGIDEAQFALCVSNNDVAMLTRLPGVGKKTAERLIIEMRDKLDDLAPSGGDVSNVASGQSIVSEAVEALLALGYKAADAEKMVQRAKQGGGHASASELIRSALQATVKT